MPESQVYSKDTEIALIQKDLEKNTKDTTEILTILRGKGSLLAVSGGGLAWWKRGINL